MEEKETDILSCFRPVAEIDKSRGITLVQHKDTGRFYVKKVLLVYNPEVYRYLVSHYIKGMARVVEAEEKDGKLTVIEEYISGDTLREVLDNGNLFSADSAARIVLQLCPIIAQLHSASPPIIHRDIKPSNIILTSDGGLRLLDMNAARQADPKKKEDTELMGTVGYAAPEQYGFGPSGVKTDIYSVGVLLCEMVTGQLPKEGIPDGKIGNIIKKCTSIDPRRRYRDMEDLAHALRNCLSSDEEKNCRAASRRHYPPGFRSITPSNIFVAAVGYSGLASLSFTFTAKDFLPGLMTILERVLLLTGGLVLIIFTCNYMDIWDVFRISRIRNPWLKTLAVFVIDAAVAFLFLIIMIIVVVLMGGGK